MIEFCERGLPFLLAATRQDQPGYILHDFTCLWGKYVSQILQIPAIATIPQFPVNMKRRPDPYPGMVSDMIRMFLGGIPALIQFRRTAHRISQAYSVPRAGLWDMLANHEDLNIVFTSRYFQPHAEDFDDSFVFVGPSIAERGEALDFSLDFGQGPLVYISLGTILNVNVPFYRSCFQAFGGTQKRIVLSAGAGTDLDSLGAIPENFVVRNFVPQLEILKRADVFITHGGMNSVSEGLWYGVPLVVVPQGSDQYLVARRVETLNAGVALDKRRLTPEALRQAVDSVALEGIRANIETIQDSFREAGGFVRAADAVMGATRR
jgi:MGT family glycosyltransferase